jgi:hypothetical protein
MITELRLMYTSRTIKVGDTIDFNMEVNHSLIAITFTVIAITHNGRLVLTSQDKIILAQYNPDKHKWTISKAIDLFEIHTNLIVDELAPLNKKQN